MYELVILTGESAGQSVAITGTFLVGREKTADLVLSEGIVGRRHAEFESDGDLLTVTDPGSRNGTLLNGRRIVGTETVHDGDIIQIGSTSFRVQQVEPSATTFTAIEDVTVTRQLDLSVLGQSPANDLSAKRLSAIMKASKVLTHIESIDRVFEDVVSALLDLLQTADRVFILLGDRVESLQARTARSHNGESIAELRWSVTICRRALESRQAIRFDIQETPQSVTQSATPLFRSALVIPLIVGEATLGLLQIDSFINHAFADDDLDSASAIAQQAALAIHVAMLLQRIDRDRRTRDQLIRFLPLPLVEQALRGEIELALGGREQEATILFADIIGFTQLAEGLAAEVVIELMNDYFAAMVPMVYQTEGSIDKFIGDAIMAVWGVHSQAEEAPRLAAMAALKMQNALAAFNSKQLLLRLPELHIGIGINTGSVVSGNIGAERRVEYTVLGDAVNVAQRIESVAARSQILIGERTRERLGNCIAVRMPPLTVKNKKRPISTFSLRGVGDGGNLLLHLPISISGMRAFLVRKDSDGLLTILHEAGLTVSGEIRGAVAELPQEVWGKIVRVNDVLPGQPEDALMLRSRVEVDDTTLGAILSGDDLVTTASWGELARG